MGWMHKLLNPHCEHCAQERREQREESRGDHICDSCETLRRQLEIRNHEYDQLLNRLLREPVTENTSVPVNITQPRMTSWNIRRQMLEAEDRKKAQLMSKAPQPLINDMKIDEVNSLENELTGVKNA